MSPTLTLLHGTAESTDEARSAAMRVIAEAYAVALALLHPDDVEERAWYRERLRDARCAAGLPAVTSNRGEES